MRKLIFRLGINFFFQTLISWSVKHVFRKYYAIFLRRKLRIQKHLQNMVFFGLSESAALSPFTFVKPIQKF